MDPTTTAPNKSRNRTDKNEAANTTPSRRSLKCGLMSSQLIILAPSSMMTAAMAGMGMMAITSARKSTSNKSHNAELAMAIRLCVPSLCTSHMRLNDAQVGSEERNGSRQLDTASEKIALRASVKPPTLRLMRRIAATV